MNYRLMISASMVAVFCSGGVQAQNTVDFGNIPGVDKRPTVEITLNPAMLGFVAAATRDSDPGTADLLSGLEGITVHVYEGVGDAQPAVLQFIEHTAALLEGDGWQRAVTVQDGDDHVRVYMRAGDGEQAGSVTGLTVMVADGGGDAVFVNVAGTIDPTKLGQIAGAVGMDGVLDGLIGAGAAAAAGGGAAGD
jgi:hypothetical protein